MDRTSLNSIRRFFIHISSFDLIPMRMVPLRSETACSAIGLAMVAPVSFVKDVVTIKKISMMKTISSMGVILISASSVCACRFVWCISIDQCDCNKSPSESVSVLALCSSQVPKYTPESAATMPAMVGTVAIETPAAMARALPEPA